MIKRDKYGIICQHHKDSPDDGYLDGGDSCARTGIMGFFSSDDIKIHRLFLVPLTVNGDTIFQLVRHPYQDEWNKPESTSRDNVVQYFACKYMSMDAFTYANKWFINKDFLDPAVKLYLYKSSPKPAPWWLEKLGILVMWASMYFNTCVKPDEEMNQFTCMCIKYGPEWSARLLSWHPDIEKNIRDYWGGWRDQPEVGEALIKKLKQTAYSGMRVPSYA